MTTASIDQMWSRSKYPLNPSSQGSAAPSSPTTSQSDEESLPSLAQLLERAPAPWYHAVTADEDQHSRNITNTDVSSLHLKENNHEPTDRSSVAYSQSRNSTSPPSIAPDHHSQQNEVAGASSQYPLQLQPSGPSDTPQPRDAPWSHDADPIQANDNMVNSSEVAHSPDQSPEQSPVQAPGRTRTLRRTPRSRRITSPVSVKDINPPRRSSDEGSTVVSISNPWKRQGYPLHAPANDSSAQQLPPPPYQKESTPTPSSPRNASQPEGHQDQSTENSAWHRQLHYSSPESNALPPSSSSSRAESNATGGSAPATESNEQARALSATAGPKKALRRQVYPLQSPASVANLRRSPSPPQSASESELAPTNDASKSPQNNAKDAATVPVPAPAPASFPPSSSSTPASAPAPTPAPKKKTTFRRQAYPLQSPASTANLRREDTPPPSPQSEDDSIHSDWESTDSTVRNSSPVLPNGKFRRHKYPLQQSNKVVAIPVTAPKSPPKESLSQPLQQPSQEAAKPAPPSNQNSSRQAYPLQSPLPERQAAPSTPKPKFFKRQKYPLQSPASHANLAEQVLSLSSPTQPSGPSKLEEQPTSAPAPQETESAAAETHSSQLQESPVSDASSAQMQAKDEALADKDSREHKLAIRTAKMWRRESYPLASPKGFQPYDHPTTPYPHEDAAPRPKKYSLPKNIRAVKNAEDDPVKGRTIVVCLDGTGDKFDNDNSNIVHIVSALKKDDPQQVTYYQAGIGTYGDRGLTSGFEAAADMAVGSGLGLHVRDAYHFLMHSYKEGDKICIFGFSRGAYTARCLAGMIHKVGLLPPRNIQQIYFAYQFYTDTSKEGWVQSEMFKKTFSIDVNVYLLGCFDSVASVGFIPRQLPLSSTPTAKARYFRHAMALDERRAKFKICRHQKAGWADEVTPHNKTAAALEQMTKEAHEILPNYKTQNDVPPGYHRPQRYGTGYHPNVTDEEYEELKGHEPAFETDVHEVWFAGAHADVGGGAVPNDERHKLAQIPLRWMIRQAFECNTGIIFKTKMLAEFGLDIHTLWPKYERLPVPLHAPPPSVLEKYKDALPPRQVRRDKLVEIDKVVNGEQFYDLVSHDDDDWTPELVEDFYDAMSPLNDQLIQAPTWWILEFMPVEYKVPLAPGEVQLRTGMNWGQYRGVEDVEPKLHWTVRHRVQNTDYKIRARTAKNTDWRIVV